MTGRRAAPPRTVRKLLPVAAAGLNQNVSRQRIINASSQSDMRILFNGGYFALFNAFSCTYLFTTLHNTTYPNDTPEGKGGRTMDRSREVGR